MSRLTVNLLLGAMVWLPVLALAAMPEHTLTIKNHKFSPGHIAVPADQRVKLIIKNEDPTPEEFESRPLNREKVIPAKSKAILFIGPLKPGVYKFTGEFHEDTAHGAVIVK